MLVEKEMKILGSLVPRYWCKRFGLWQQLQQPGCWRVPWFEKWVRGYRNTASLLPPQSADKRQSDSIARTQPLNLAGQCAIASVASYLNMLVQSASAWGRGTRTWR